MVLLGRQTDLTDTVFPKGFFPPRPVKPGPADGLRTCRAMLVAQLGLLPQNVSTCLVLLGFYRVLIGLFCLGIGFGVFFG